MPGCKYTHSSAKLTICSPNLSPSPVLLCSSLHTLFPFSREYMICSTMKSRKVEPRLRQNPLESKVLLVPEHCHKAKRKKKKLRLRQIFCFCWGGEAANVKENFQFPASNEIAPSHLKIRLSEISL